MNDALPFAPVLDVPIRPLCERMRTADGRTGGVVGTPATVALRAAFGAAQSDADQTRVLEEDPEFQRRVQAARRKAEEEGLLAAQARIDACIERYAQGLERLTRALQSARMPRADEVVDLALAVARAILGHEARIDAAALVRDIQQAMAVVGSNRPTLRVCAQDAARICVLVPDLPQRLHLVPDADLAPGDFILEDQDRVIDGTVSARLEAVRSALVTLIESQDPRPAEAASAEAP